MEDLSEIETMLTVVTIGTPLWYHLLETLRLLEMPEEVPQVEGGFELFYNTEWQRVNPINGELESLIACFGYPNPPIFTWRPNRYL
jgi:hypothetical protein